MCEKAASTAPVGRRCLQVIFPEEMKAVRNGIDAIRRELNTITTSLAHTKQKSLVDTIQTLHQAPFQISS
jgi:hypothetical protein